MRELADLGTGVFVAAARHAAERNALEPAGEAELARELLDAYVRPLLGELDPDAEALPARPRSLSWRRAVPAR